MSKRVFDIVCSVIGLIVLFPLNLLIVVILKIFQGDPVFFTQERIGRGGKSFNIYKFRSMRQDSEQEGQPRLAKKNDDRETSIGRFLRKHHIDELPQLWNVLKGDMSIVGPRPERQYYIDQIVKENPKYVELYQIRPGLTSYATLYNGYTDNMEKMLKRLNLDLYYMVHQSFWGDMKIIAETVKIIFFGGN
ncbi:Sugar transferase involved in LPS biosynthesis (colanic, teichoic acid) [Xylanibacter ruminicola]|uniref:Sugar transferase involved in LPS biosynthesis (Colanic, teichoic acid) n=1 Tax=Xylanibacter ruminicola TaxID=839 RepID=A0A1H4C524_XYLRU|nr:sugar transferase [Xylanibacter ruminicola]SEA55454.1 Sugar transferase involved in LPS biosynthesis (colanic, teichoic acid) [Xylanibacter ruminicola]